MSEDFADGIDNERSENSEFTKTVYMRLEDGHKYTIRVLEPKATKIFTHFLGGRYSVKCLGDNCPTKIELDKIIKKRESRRRNRKPSNNN